MSLRTLVHCYHFYQLNQSETSRSVFQELMLIGINYNFPPLIAHGLPRTRTNLYHEAYHKQHLSDSSLATEHDWEHFGNRYPPKTQSWRWGQAQGGTEWGPLKQP